MTRPTRWALVGDAQSPHLLKWARALAPRTELWVASSRGFLPDFNELVPAERRLGLNTQPRFEGGNIGLLRQLPRLARWLRQVDADWINPHYLSSHGTLVWLAQALWGLRGRMLASAWGSDILVAPQRSLWMAWALRRVLGAAAACTSDSHHMARAMQALGARKVEVFPFGLDNLPPTPAAKQPWLCYANRGLEAIYQPQRVLQWFASLAAQQPDARLVVANDGALRPGLEQWVAQQGLTGRVRFVGRIEADAQHQWYACAQWYISLPQSDSVSVSVLEAMAWGCIPLLSDLPANRELVQHGGNGLILGVRLDADLPALEAMRARATDIAQVNRAWVEQEALFEPCIHRLLQTLAGPVPA